MLRLTPPLIMWKGMGEVALHPPLTTLPAPTKQMCRLPFVLLLKVKWSLTPVKALPTELFRPLSKMSGLSLALKMNLLGLSVILTTPLPRIMSTFRLLPMVTMELPETTPLLLCAPESWLLACPSFP